MADAGLQAPDAPASPAPRLCNNLTTSKKILHLNWSHFKPEFSGKPKQDAEAHLLRMKEVMNTHQFQECIKVQRFCLTLVGEARLWYESLRPINEDWHGLQN